MSKKILIISATSRNNLDLSNHISEITTNLNNENELLNLEKFDIPLYTPIRQKGGTPEIVNELIPKFINASGFIFCAPEYNGSIPPILTNLMAWISVSTDQWRDVFNGKMALLGTHSGGGGNNFIQSMKIQLGHLGAIVLPRTIVVNSYTKFNPESTEDKIKQLISLL
jgi:chromate reductase, NAD(P)H dehydrogenase (quinone)